MVEMIKVKSSNLLEIGYNEETARLYVRFIGGKLYCYDPCPSIIFLGLRYSHSKGRFLATQIVPFFRCRHVSDSELKSKVSIH